MAAFVIVLAYPELMAACFVMLFFAYRGAGASGRLDEHGFYWYPVFLMIPLAASLATVAGRRTVEHGLRDLGGYWAPALVIGGVCVGVALYRLDAATAQVGPAERARSRASNTILEGRFEALERFRPGMPLFVALALAVVVAEEVVWRGYLIRAIPRLTVVPLAAALVLAALSYGSAHYYFGLRNVAIKAVHGLVWGLAFLITGSLLLPLASHMTFELIVGRQFWRRRTMARMAVP